MSNGNSGRLTEHWAGFCVCTNTI